MWHAARRREKETQKLLNEHKKRAEKRREENRVDPSSLLQINGLRSKLHLDPTVYKQAVKSLVPWQGDKNVSIDRFDVRATLTSIPKEESACKSGARQQESSKSRGTVIDADESEALKRLLTYERFRLLIQNDLNKTPEDLRLKLVAKGEQLSDAKMKKLRYNKFGTSGDAAIANAQSYHERPTNTFRQHAHESTRRGVAIGFSYSSVPPPASLTDSTKDSGVIDPKHHQSISLDHIVDLDDNDCCDLDSVNIQNLDDKYINETAKRYGLTSSELTFLVDRDIKGADTKDIMKEFQKLLAKMQASAEKSSDLIYGPALPPGLMYGKSSNNDCSSPSSDGSPVRQRSPSGADIPLRKNGQYDHSDSDSSNPPKSPQNNTPQELSRSSPPHVVKDKSPQTREPNQSSHVIGSEVNDKKGLQQCSKAESICNPLDPPDDGRVNDATDNNQETNQETDRKSGGKEGGSKQYPARRASTPLLYKRNRRSSRSLSRERRSDKSRHSRRSPSPLRRHKRRRYRSSSRSSSGSINRSSDKSSPRHSRKRSRSNRSKTYRQR